jgi:hypothetical protein
MVPEGRGLAGDGGTGGGGAPDDRTRVQVTGPARVRSLDRRGLEAALAGRYRIEDVIGAGGMGQVYLATDLVLERQVALKTVLPEALSDPRWFERFRIEATAAAGLQHASIVQVHEVVEVSGVPVLVMEYVRGVDLGRLVATRRPSDREVARLMAQVCDALAHAHAHGVVHRDIKPGNVLVGEDGVPKLADFGLAVRRREGSGPVAEEGVVGSPAYMAPEQARGDPAGVDSRADVYALGATLYFALTGRPPFAGASFTEVIERVLRSDLIPPSRVRASVDPDLEAICLRAMAPDPAARYPGASAMTTDLRAALAGLPVSARRYGLAERVRRGVGARKEAFALAFAAVLLMVIGIGAAVYVLHAEATEAVVDELRRKLMSLASTAVLLVPPEQVEAAIRAPAPDNPHAQALAALLHRVRQRGADIRYVWLMRPSEQGLPRMTFVVSDESYLSARDLDENGNGVVDPQEQPARPGDPFDASPYPALVRGLEGPAADRDYRATDPWDVALSGYAPVRDGSGQTLAVFGVDVSRPDLAARFARLDRSRLLAFVLSGVLAVAATGLIVSTLVGVWMRQRPAAGSALAVHEARP